MENSSVYNLESKFWILNFDILSVKILDFIKVQPQFVKPQFIEPQFVELAIKRHFVEPQFIEPQFVEPQFVELPSSSNTPVCRTPFSTICLRRFRQFVCVLQFVCVVFDNLSAFCNFSTNVAYYKAILPNLT
jgi:hypothetical protein